MKVPAAARAMAKFCERAYSEEWSYERFTEALLSTEIASRDASGGELRIKAERFPASLTSCSRSTRSCNARSLLPTRLLRSPERMNKYLTPWAMRKLQARRRPARAWDFLATAQERGGVSVLIHHRERQPELFGHWRTSTAHGRMMGAG
jgi:hypothetical protein